MSETAPESGAAKRRALRTDQTVAKLALRQAHSGAKLALWLPLLGLVQMCCGGAPAGEHSGNESTRFYITLVSMFTSLGGGALALPAWVLFTRGVGGRAGTTRYVSRTAHIAAGRAERPRLLPWVFVVCGVSTGVLIVAKLITVLAILPVFDDYWPLTIVAGLFVLIAGLCLAWCVKSHRLYAATLRTLPPPDPPPPGALPAAGSLESAALGLAGAARRASLAGTLLGALWLFALIQLVLFGGRPEALAGMPLSGVATFACFRAYRGLHVFLGGRDPHVVGALGWGVLGGLLGMVPVVLTAALLLGNALGWWTTRPGSFPRLLRYGLGQPYGLWLAPFLLPLGFCGITLVIFGRELTTKKSHEERESEQAHLGGDAGLD